MCGRGRMFESGGTALRGNGLFVERSDDGAAVLAVLFAAL